MKKQIIFNFTFVFFFILNIEAQNTTFNNVAIGTDDPAYGVKIKSNFPGYTGGWARSFSVSNENGSQNWEPDLVPHLIQEESKGRPKRAPENMTGAKQKICPTLLEKTNAAPSVFYAWPCNPSARSALESELSIGILA